MKTWKLSINETETDLLGTGWEARFYDHAITMCSRLRNIKGFREGTWHFKDTGVGKNLLGFDKAVIRIVCHSGLIWEVFLYEDADPTIRFSGAFTD